MDIYEELVRLRNLGQKCALATIVEVRGSIPSYESAKLLVREDGSMAGTIGGGLMIPFFARLGWRLARKPVPRPLNIVTSLMVLVGGLILRVAWIVAGRASAEDPQATHYYNAMERKRT